MHSAPRCEEPRASHPLIVVESFQDYGDEVEVGGHVETHGAHQPVLVKTSLHEAIDISLAPLEYHVLVLQLPADP